MVEEDVEDRNRNRETAIRLYGRSGEWGERESARHNNVFWII